MGGDCSDQRMQGDYSDHPEAIRTFGEDTFLDLHHQRLLADVKDPSATFTYCTGGARLVLNGYADAINGRSLPIARRTIAIAAARSLRRLRYPVLPTVPGAQEPAD